MNKKLVNRLNRRVEKMTKPGIEEGVGRRRCMMLNVAVSVKLIKTRLRLFIRHCLVDLRWM